MARALRPAAQATAAASRFNRLTEVAVAAFSTRCIASTAILLLAGAGRAGAWIDGHVFVDNAQEIVRRVVPRRTRDQIKQAIIAGAADANRWGLVSVHDPGEPQEVLEVLEDLARSGQLTLRVYAMISDDSTPIARSFARGPQNLLYDGHLSIRSIKMYMDGALGSRGAAVLDPYSDDPGNCGLLVSAPDFVVLDQDIMRAPADAILATRVVATYIGGTPVYERGADSTAH